MVKQHKPSHSISGSENCSGNSSNHEKDNDQVYCVVLHVVEAINFYGRDGERDQIVMNAALNTVDFEVEGKPSATAETIVFNSNCIWECDMAGIKRIKTDHRPVKVTFFSCSSQNSRKTIGTLLLPVRGLPVLSAAGNQTALQLKMFWHKLICISNEFRSHKPEVLLMLAIIKKSLLHTKDFEYLMQFAHRKSPPTPPLQSPGHSITSSMLQSQANVYVQSLVQLGLLQVGNDPLIDCDIIEVVLQLKQLKNVGKLVKSLNHGKEINTVLLVFDFVGNVTNIELKLNETDAYTLNDVLGLRFKSSLRSMRLYFQRIFYLPINMYINGTAIANYRMDFGKLLPADSYFAENRKYVHNGSFTFNRFGRMDSARELKPLMEYTFSVDVRAIYSRQALNEELVQSTSMTSSVIRELPQEHKDSEEGSKSWKQSDNNSVASLEVGAELSASESNTDSAPDEAVDSDAPADLPKNQSRRKKFTRLTDEAEESHDSEEEAQLDMRRKISSTDSEADIVASYNNRKFHKEKNEKTTKIKRKSLVKTSEESLRHTKDLSKLVSQSSLVKLQKSRKLEEVNQQDLEELPYSNPLKVAFIGKHPTQTSTESRSRRKPVYTEISSRVTSMEECLDETRAECVKSRESLLKIKSNRNVYMNNPDSETECVAANKQKITFHSTEDYETKLSKPGVKKKLNSELSARWVKVNKEQTLILNETERYIEETCQIKLDKFLNDVEPQSQVKSKPMQMNASIGEDLCIHSSNQKKVKKKYVIPLQPKGSYDLLDLHVTDSASTLTNSKSQELSKDFNKMKLTRKLSKEAELRKKRKPVELEQDLEAPPSEIPKKKPTKAGLEQSSEKSPRKCISRDQSINTEPIDFEQTVYLQLETWKQHQMVLFQKELARKELQYKSKLEQQANKCPTLGASPDETLIFDYETKFKKLEQHIDQLKQQLSEQSQLFEQRNRDIQEENIELLEDKLQLKERIAHMEQQIKMLENQSLDGRDLKQVVNELRSQNERISDISREKDRYKKQWRRCAKRLHDLKFAMYEKNLESERKGLDINVLNLKSIITKDADAFEKEYGQFRHSPNSMPSFPLSSSSGEVTSVPLASSGVKNKPRRRTKH